MIRNCNRLNNLENIFVHRRTLYPCEIVSSRLSVRKTCALDVYMCTYICICVCALCIWWFLIWLFGFKKDHRLLHTVMYVTIWLHGEGQCNLVVLNSVADIHVHYFSFVFSRNCSRRNGCLLRVCTIWLLVHICLQNTKLSKDYIEPLWQSLNLLTLNKFY